MKAPAVLQPPDSETIDLLSLGGTVESAVRGVTIEDMDEAIGQAAEERFKRKFDRSRDFEA